MLAGNYSRPDDQLPSNEGYQSVGEVIALGPEVSELSIGDLVFIGAHTGTQRSPAGHVEFVTIAEDDLVLKLPSDIDPVHAALCSAWAAWPCAVAATPTCAWVSVC